MPRKRRYKGLVTTSFYVPLELAILIERLDTFAKNDGTSRNQIIIDALIEYVNRRGDELSMPKIEPKIMSKLEGLQLFKDIGEIVERLDANWYDYEREKERDRTKLKRLLKKFSKFYEQNKDDNRFGDVYRKALMRAYPDLIPEIDELLDSKMTFDQIKKHLER